MDIVAVIVFAILMLGLLLCGVALIKNEITAKCRLRIADAIYLYAMDQIHKDEPIEVYYDDIEPYDNTFHRWWDWGYKRILPADKFEIIKPYLEIKKEKKDVN